MSVFVIGDLHLALGADKPMDIFPGWEGYLAKVEANWKSSITAQDTVVIPGDVSWAMSLAGALEDFRWLNALPGQKYLLKGNHDYWWTTMAKMVCFLEEKGFETLRFIYNSAAGADGMALCGTRGWCFENGEAADAKVMAREAGRLERSLQMAAQKFPEAERVAFLHYPPVYLNQTAEDLLAVMLKYGVKKCFYAHLHSHSIKCRTEGDVGGICFRLVSADGLGFKPLRIEKSVI